MVFAAFELHHIAEKFAGELVADQVVVVVACADASADTCADTAATVAQLFGF